MAVGLGSLQIVEAFIFGDKWILDSPLIHIWPVADDGVTFGLDEAIVAVVIAFSTKTILKIALWQLSTGAFG